MRQGLRIRRMSRSLVPLALSGLLAFVSIAGIAYAATKFDPSNKKIVINKSIAGVKLGQSVADAKRAWKGNVRCSRKGDASACHWGNARKGYLGFIYSTGVDKVFKTTIFSGVARHKHVFVKPLTTVKTSKGITIGSSLAAVKKAYPGGRNDTDDDRATIEYYIRRGKDSTLFEFTEKRRVYSIEIERGPPPFSLVP